MQTQNDSHTPADGGPSSEPPTSRRKKTVLLVVDDVITRLLLQKKLELAGLDISIAADGRAGLDYLQQHEPADAIVLELTMPGVSGMDIIRAARRNHSFGNRPIYVCATASTIGQWARRGKKADAARIFDRTATSVDFIIAEITEELTGVRPSQSELGTTTIARMRREVQAARTGTPAGSNEEPLSPETVAARELELPQLVAVLRKATSNLKRSANRTVKSAHFNGLKATIRAVSDCARGCGRKRCVAAVQAVQLYINEISQKEERLNDSHVRNLFLGVQTISKTSEEPVASRHWPAEFSAVLVEPELVVRAAACNAFRQSCVKVVALPTSAKAIKHLQANKTDLVIFGPANDDQVQKSFAEELKKVTVASRPRFVAMRELAPGSARKGFAVLKKTQGTTAVSTTHPVELMLRCVIEVLNLEHSIPEQASSNTISHSPAFKNFPPLQDEPTQDEEPSEAVNPIPLTPAAHVEPPIRASHASEENETVTGFNDSAPAMVFKSISQMHPSPATDEVAPLQARIAELEAKLAEQLRAKEYLVRVLRDKPMVSEASEDTAQHDSTTPEHGDSASAESAKKAEDLERLLAERSESFARALGDLEKRLQEQMVLEAENEALREALREASGRTESLRRELTGRIEQLDSELLSRQTAMEALKQKVEEEHSARAKMESEWQDQLEQSRAEKEESALAAEQSRQDLLGAMTEQLAAARNEAEALKTRLEAEQKNAAESLQWIEELENTVRNGLAERDTLRADLAKLADEKSHLESQLGELRHQLNQTETGVQGSKEHQDQLAREREELQRELAGLTERSQADQKVIAKLTFQMSEADKRLAQTMEALQRTSEALVRETAEKNRLNEAMQKVSGSTEQMESELSALRVRETNYKVDLSSRERRVRDGIASLARITTELENERNERRRSEQRVSFLSSQLQELHDELARHLEAERSSQNRLTNFEEQLREREAMVARINASLQKETAERQLVTEQLRSKEELTVRLRQHIELFEQAKQAFRRTEEELASRLEASRNLMNEKDATLQREIASRQRLEESLAETHRRLEEQSQQLLVEKAKLESALHVEMLERKRLENELLDSRCSRLEIPGVGQAFVESFCAQLVEPMENLLHSTRRLLELPLDNDQKQLVESALQDALVLRSSLQEPSGLDEDNARRETTSVVPTEELSSSNLQP